MLELITNSFSLYLQGALLPALLMGIWVWKADKILSSQGAEKRFSQIDGVTEITPGSKPSHSLLQLIESHFNISKSSGFFLNVFYLTFFSILAALFVYSALFAGGNIFQRQAILQMLPLGFITYWANIFGFLIYPAVSKSIASNSFVLNVLAICADIGIKCILFISFYALYYLYLSDFGPTTSIGACTYREALGFVPMILAGAIKFQNYSAVFLYSLFFASFPIYVLFLINMMERHQTLRKAIRSLLFWLPFKNKPLRVLGVLFSILLGTFALVIAILLKAIPHETLTIIC